MRPQVFIGRRAAWAVATVTLATALASARANADPLSFKGAQLGMTLAEWRSLPPPDGAGPIAVPACSDEPRMAALAPNPLSASLRAGDVVACAYLDLFGHTALPHSIRLDPAYRAEDLQYRFAGGRLVEIRFKTSIDAYSDVMTMLEGQCGRPSETTRGEAPTAEGRIEQVSQRWRTPNGKVLLVDPSDDPTKLQVRMSASNADEARSAIASSTQGP